MTTTNIIENTCIGQMVVTKTNVGSATSITISNSDNSDVTSHSYVKIESGGAGGGDAQATLYNSVAYTSLGLDNSDGDALVVSRNASLGTTNYARCDTTGNWTYPANNTFLINGNGSFQANITGDGSTSTYLVPYSVSVFNIGSSYNTGAYEFTVPISGIYYFSGQCHLSGGSNCGWADTLIRRNGSDILRNAFGIQYYGIAGWNAGIPSSGIFDCDAGDTIKLYIMSYDLGGKVQHTDLYPDYTWFTGVLLA